MLLLSIFVCAPASLCSLLAPCILLPLPSCPCHMLVGQPPVPCPRPQACYLFLVCTRRVEPKACRATYMCARDAPDLTGPRHSLSLFLHQILLVVPTLAITMPLLWCCEENGTTRGGGTSAAGIFFLPFLTRAFFCPPPPPPPKRCGEPSRRV